MKRHPNIGDVEVAHVASELARRCPPFPDAARFILEHARNFAPLDLLERLGEEPEKELEAARAWFAKARREIPPDATRLRVRPSYTDEPPRLRLQSAAEDGPWNWPYPKEEETRRGSRRAPPPKPPRDMRARLECPSLVPIVREFARLERRSDARLLATPCEVIDAQWRAATWFSHGIARLWGALLLRDVVGEARAELLSESRPALRVFCSPGRFAGEDDRSFEIGAWTAGGWTPFKKVGKAKPRFERPYDFEDGYRDTKKILRATAGLPPGERLLAGWNAILARCRRISPQEPAFWDRIAALDPRAEAEACLRWFEDSLERASLEPDEGALWFGLFDVPTGWTLRAASRWSARTFDWFYDDRILEWPEPGGTPASRKNGAETGGRRRRAAFGSAILETGVYGAPIPPGARRIPDVLSDMPGAMERLFSLAWAALLADHVGRNASMGSILKAGCKERALLVGHPDSERAILVGRRNRDGWRES